MAAGPTHSREGIQFVCRLYILILDNSMVCVALHNLFYIQYKYHINFQLILKFIYPRKLVYSLSLRKLQAVYLQLFSNYTYKHSLYIILHEQLKY